VNAHRGPYEYSAPSHPTDFFPQWETEHGKPKPDGSDASAKTGHAHAAHH
jgi:hypothetical protein